MNSKDSQNGFTLLEAMVAVAIMGVIMVLVWSSTSQSLNTKDRVEKRDMIFHQGRVALRKMSDDLQVAFLFKASTSRSTGEASELPSMKSFFIGTDSGDRDSVRFSSLSHLRLFADAKECDQTKIQYEIAQSKDDSRLYNLVRRETPWLDDNTEVEGKSFVLVENITEFNLEYYDDRKNEWGREWDTEKPGWRNKLPSAVRMSIVFPDPDFEDQEIPMSTAVLVPLYKQPIEF